MIDVAEVVRLIVRRWREPAAIAAEIDRTLASEKTDGGRVYRIAGAGSIDPDTTALQLSAQRQQRTPAPSATASQWIPLMVAIVAPLGRRSSSLDPRLVRTRGPLAFSVGSTMLMF